MEIDRYKIALITAHIGNTDKPELTITAQCQKELDEYGVEIHRFNNSTRELLERNIMPQNHSVNIIKNLLKVKLRFWFKLLIVYRQLRYPQREVNYNRLLAKIPKILFFKLVQEKYDYYIWCDSKFTLEEGWLNYILGKINENKNRDLLTFAHSERNSIHDEFKYMEYYMHNVKTRALLSKYNLAEMDRQVYIYEKDKEFNDNKLFEVGMTVYSKYILQKKEFLEEWYAHNYYLSIQDQLSFPYLVFKYKINVGTINESIYKTGFAFHKHY